MKCTRGLDLYTAIAAFPVGSVENRELRAVYLNHVWRCNVCKDHFSRLVGWAREIEKVSLSIGIQNEELSELRGEHGTEILQDAVCNEAHDPVGAKSHQ
jgi:hypothetical protein